ncbi:MAG: DNA polymerase III subunit gamma/tau [bacterium]|nr:DNA polymerase III subunit gamma/tau [bacterium]
MAYTVLARKYRSRTFDEIIGQDAIATTLKNAVTGGRIHHGYLFTGTRGVGKTSMARILAKALNCLACDAPTATPCCECEACRLISQGEDIDVVEIDAASNTGVENIRELRSNASFRPARSRHKVYIIDEVHMLSISAFNALLKTLEEPPDHVKFILATTEAHKVPATIKSRCQRFDFRAIDTDTIAAQLRCYLDAEKIEADDAVLRRVARLAAGSMRDALSLLDQVLSLGAERLTLQVVEDVLPSPLDDTLREVIERVADSDAAGALRAVDRCLAQGRTVERFCEALIEYLRTMMLVRVCGVDTELIDVTDAQRASLGEQADRFDAETFVYMISLVEEIRQASRWSSASRPLVDAAVVRLASAKNFSSLESVIERLEGGVPTRGAANPGGAQDASSPPVRKTGTQTRAAAAKRRPIGSDAVPNRSTGASPPRQSARRSGSEDTRKAMANPAVRKTMELFEGSTVVDVRRARSAPEASAGGAGAEGGLTSDDGSAEES